MFLTAGTRLGPYEVLAPIGFGGPITALLAIAMSLGCDRDGRSLTATPSSDPSGGLVLRDDRGRTLTTNDLATAAGPVRYDVVVPDSIPSRAQTLHEEARRHGSRGEFQRTLELLAEAQALAPDWPYPTYDMAFTYLQMKSFAKAREMYDKTVKMSPRGFFTAITAAHTLHREAAGELPEGTYLTFVALEGRVDSAQRKQIFGALVEDLPQFAPWWKEYSLALEDPKDRLVAIERGLGAGPDAETKGILLINKALALGRLGNKEAAREILTGLARDSETTLANEQPTKVALAMVDR